ncbi:hypothetical protein DKX38_006036 [Salix brachista]|uniref:Uncharacterized protein n=1 Tax=Salix brachista TaxID=2182728 RepID=A0A5N5N191_9ROSI|nr:hypothetical protein DKX38_006036 [Salix brachista]
MGQETEDSQKLRRIAAAAYDYDNDPRWADYLSNILIPPHLSSRSDVLDHFKRKFYQRYIWVSDGYCELIPPFLSVELLMRFGSAIGSTSFVILGYAFKPNIKDPDLVVEVMSTNGSSQSMPSASSYSSSPPSDGQPRTRNTGSTARASGPSATAGQNPTSVRWDRQTIQFSVNAWIGQKLVLTVFVVAVLAIIPLAPINLSRRTYRLSFMGTACSSLYSLYTLYGRPRALNLQGIQVYLQSIMATKDFIYFIYCITFVTSHLCLKFALISILCRSLEHVAKFLRRNFSRSTLYRKYLENPCVWVESNTTTLSILSSHTEIGLGFLLIVSLFSWQRNIIQTFMYWQVNYFPIMQYCAESLFDQYRHAFELNQSFDEIDLFKSGVLIQAPYHHRGALLKLMYHAPVTAGYHQSVWANIGRTINPLVHRHCPFLNTPLSAVQRWWLR